MNWTWENGKKPNFGPNFGSFGPNLGLLFSWILLLLDIRHCCKLSLYAISRKTKDPNSRKWQKNLNLGLILAPWAQIQVAISFFFFFFFFFKNLALPVTRYHGELSSCIISEKTNDPIFWKFCHGWINGQIDGPSDWQTVIS